MSRVYRWGYERGYVKGNPCAGVSKSSLKAREHYITDEDYRAIYKHADHVVRAAMEISYLCAARQAAYSLCAGCNFLIRVFLSSKERPEKNRLRSGHLAFSKRWKQHRQNVQNCHLTR